MKRILEKQTQTAGRQESKQAGGLSKTLSKKKCRMKWHRRFLYEHYPDHQET